MEQLFTWFSIIAFIVYGAKEIRNPYGDDIAGLLLIAIAIILIILETSPK